MAEQCRNEKMGIKMFLDDLLSAAFLKLDKMPGEIQSTSWPCRDVIWTAEPQSLFSKETHNIFMIDSILFGRNMVSRLSSYSVSKVLSKVSKTIMYWVLLIDVIHMWVSNTKKQPSQGKVKVNFKHIYFSNF